MVEYLKTVWLRVVHPKFARALEFRVKALENAVVEIKAKIKWVPPDLEKVEEKEEPKPRLSKSWAQRRAYLEVTDGGRIKTGGKL